MSQEALLRKIKLKAKHDEKNRRDHRFLNTMGFLVAKGFLKTNLEVQLMPNKRLYIDDVIWAGQNVEPRILEVLPAAVLRLGKHFDLDPLRHEELALVIDCLKSGDEIGVAFFGIPYDKLKVWAELPLRDKRVKTLKEKKVVKTFRLDPHALERLRRMARENEISETEVLENLLMASTGRS